MVANTARRGVRLPRGDRFLSAARIQHGCRWMANNVSLETDAADNWKPSRKKSRERIDGVVGLIMAVGIMLANPAPPEPEFWIYF